jgi:hypothetical protein
MSEYIDQHYTDHNEYETVVFEDYKIYIVNEEENETQFEELPDQWISDNQNTLLKLYDELKDMSYMNNLFQTLTFSEMCDFFDYTNVYTELDFYDFNEHIDDFPPVRRGRLMTFKQFCGHNYSTIMSIYNYIHRNYTFTCGSFEGFMGFVYENSLHW